MLIGFLNAEDAHHGSAAKAIGDALSENQTLAMSASVFAEILVGPSRSGAEAVEVVRNMVATLPIGTVPIGDEIAVTAAGLRARHQSLKLPDALVIAAAKVEGADRLVTTDRCWPAAKRLGITTELLIL
ncbi:MAG: type II toxin-antitoxin system VapC family toxin [Candidatus Microthrix sp.]|uniref:Type II toxin-antitoxin system VapC family toxin n=1 Tax=Candidatus Neomicrothrix subdominans TaxID=2954438 RepID=A0A936NFF2_9ACTN|nr:PIN domain-containing protein [Candidatus Microthrix sp.]MBK6437185.1 type II toxin-antitoxin system VapC family toxin [Candidatus Microthrix sp.]MBK9297982.1 type II toxin-antitoxin system VapC family toxin [Candidatus Microthrix subdominans]HMS46064.1 PIN domain-containing protein [Candidatus Microthrix sp.]